MFARNFLYLTLSLLFIMGLIMVFNTSSADILDRSLTQNTHQAVVKQMLYAVAALCLAFVISLIDYHLIVRMGMPLLAFFCVFLVLVFIPGIGKTINGASRWIDLGPFSFQPSEFVKILIPISYVHFLNGRSGQELDFKDFLKVLVIFFVPSCLILLEPDTGTTVIICLTFLMMLVISSVKKEYWIAPVLAGCLLFGFFAYNLPYVQKRIAVYLNPELDKRGKGHQAYQAKIAAGSGGLFGKGIGQSLQKLNYLPEAQNDYIAAIYAEEFGFLGSLVLILLYMSIVYLGFHIAFLSPDREGFYLAASLSFLICIQSFLNLAVVSGLLPSTGLNLPFFSQGGSSLIANTAAVSVLCNVSSKTKKGEKG